MLTDLWVGFMTLYLTFKVNNAPHRGRPDGTKEERKGRREKRNRKRGTESGMVRKTGEKLRGPGE